MPGRPRPLHGRERAQGLLEGGPRLRAQEQGGADLVGPAAEAVLEGGAEVVPQAEVGVDAETCADEEQDPRVPGGEAEAKGAEVHGCSSALKQ